MGRLFGGGWDWVNVYTFRETYSEIFIFPISSVWGVGGGKGIIFLEGSSCLYSIDSFLYGTKVTEQGEIFLFFVYFFTFSPFFFMLFKFLCHFQ